MSTETQTFKDVTSAIELGLDAGIRQPGTEADESHYRVAQKTAVAARGLNGPTELHIEAIATGSLGDMATIAFSAYAAGRSTGSPAQVALNSLDLLKLGKLSNPRSARLLGNHTNVLFEEKPYGWDLRHMFKRGALMVDHETLQARYRTDINTRIDEEVAAKKGCPAFGMIMERFYQRYVSVVFGPELASEQQRVLNLSA